MQVGYNKWQLGGEKLPLSGSTIPHIDGSDFWHVRFAVPSDAYEINMVFGDENGNHDNNQVRGVLGCWVWVAWFRVHGRMCYDL